MNGLINIKLRSDVHHYATLINKVKVIIVAVNENNITGRKCTDKIQEP
jgi:hypothetical protein